jgi:PUA domain protein
VALDGLFVVQILLVFDREAGPWTHTEGEQPVSLRAHPMFKKFTSSDCSQSTQVKSSAQRAIKSKIVEHHPSLENLIDDILPKKPPLTQFKAGQHLTVYCRGNEPLFFEHRDGPVLPTLRFVHQHPHLWTTYTVDKGAIPYILGGANIMCGGLTSAGARMDVDLEEGSGIVIMAEGKEHALAVGMLKMSTEGIRSVNKGMAIQVDHFLGDGLFSTEEIE